jgi:hypothetical protein
MTRFEDILDDLSRPELCEALARALEKVIGPPAQKLADDLRGGKREGYFLDISGKFGIDPDVIIVQFCREVKAMRPEFTIMPAGVVQ